MIDIRTADCAVWHALMTKSQISSNIQLPERVETYVSQLVIRAMSAQKDLGQEISETLLESSEHGDLHLIGDECLVLAGLMPERAIREHIPVSYFVNVAYRAYSQLARDSGEEVYSLLAANLVDCVDVLHTLRELEVGGSCIDPLNAFELWEDTGSQHAWQVITRLTNALPISVEAASLN